MPHKALNSLWFIRLEERSEHVHSTEHLMRQGTRIQSLLLTDSEASTKP